MVRISDFRSSLSMYLKKVKYDPIVISPQKGGEPFVLLSAGSYNKLVEERELEIDSKELVRLVKENKGKKGIPWARIRRSR
jgi:prevent-host-death family protein